MTQITKEWLSAFTKEVQTCFTDNLFFLGLQGSYQRGEINTESDIDIVILLYKMDFTDLQKYDILMQKLPFAEKLCGFFAEKEVLQCWEKSELFQFYYGTKPLYGNLDFLLSLFQKTDIQKAIKIGACNLYHACCHNFLFDRDMTQIKSFYKSAFFLLQAKYFLNYGQYIKTKKAMYETCQGVDREIMANSLKKMDDPNQEQYLNYHTDLLLQWSKQLILQY